MQNKFYPKLFYYFLISTLSFFISCKKNTTNEEECSKFRTEQYIEHSPDTVLTKELMFTQKKLLQRFEDTSVKGLNYEAYYLQYFSSHRFGKTVKFEKKAEGYFLSIKCFEKKNKTWIPECKQYQISLEEEEWNILEKMIYDFNFWTAEEVSINRSVLDGYIYLLEGNRPQAGKCDKKTYQLICRSSPEYDKMGALCEYILGYEDRLASSYGKRK